MLHNLINICLSNKENCELIINMKNISDSLKWRIICIDIALHCIHLLGVPTTFVWALSYIQWVDE